jgi:hypothetical protein
MRLIRRLVNDTFRFFEEDVDGFMMVSGFEEGCFRFLTLSFLDDDGDLKESHSFIGQYDAD